MSAKPVIPRELAEKDVAETIDYYQREAGVQVALGFVAALEEAYAGLGEHPAIGSPRYAHELQLPGLRSWPLARYPYIVFYIERSDHVDVWRVLHARRDVAAWMSEPA